ncbi:inositol monophosphatase family protein [Cellulosimicrobium marinum]|uniref:inositol monophosphatase family protein n=1 Tax=Cellulosimicrobium marinum TaxID=1638992 RepID=UPI001E3C6AF1|nr:inositol monophosphatase family protein [Cellulosimicrobium marinum]MCB7138134.1 inositol monophosphatase [Cellulosimicrobium marinum]
MHSFIDDPRLPDDVTVADLRRLAEHLARTAGELVRSGRPERVEVAATKSNATDVVTRMDADSEALLRREIAAARPGDAVLGEEDGASPGTTGITWVVDPIDGTVNYLYGVASYGVSVAAVVGPPDPQEWTVLAGAVHSVVDDRTWTAGLGGGATVDGRPLHVVGPDDLAQCLVGTGFGYDPDRRRAQARVLVDVIPRVRDIRRLGSAAIDLCLVASGELDLYYERGLNPWDLAAGGLIAQEAGARVSGLRGSPAGRAMTVAGPAARAGELVSLLEELSADSDD